MSIIYDWNKIQRKKKLKKIIKCHLNKIEDIYTRLYLHNDSGSKFYSNLSALH